MNEVSDITPALARVTEVGEARSKGVSVKADGVVRGFVAVMVEVDETIVVRISGLAQGVIASNPEMVLIMLCEFLPEPDDTVLVIFVEPEGGSMNACVGVPVPVLPTGRGMKLEDRGWCEFRAWSRYLDQGT